MSPEKNFTGDAKSLSYRLANVLASVLLLASLTTNALARDNPHARALGDSRLFTTLPADPGFPESIAVHAGRVYVSGGAQFGYFVPPAVLAYDLETGQQVASYPLQGENPSFPMAGTGLAFGKNDMLYVGSLQQGVLRFDVDNPGAPMQHYATALPDLPTCAFTPPGTPCSPTAVDSPPLINDLVFDKNGNLYITDSFQATIWRVPPGGGAPKIWFQSPVLDTSFGANGMRVGPKGDLAYFSLTFDAAGAGHILTVPLVPNPKPSDLKVFHSYTPGAGPDGIAFGKSGKLYVALAGYNQISVLPPDGVEEEARYSGPAANASNPPQPLPWANPSAIAFDDRSRSLLVANHAIFFPTPEQFFAVFDVFVDDKADHLNEPHIP
ncbi:MAG TPA: SMP-30/gluconolactonase/LRE family protein [Pyrinomonadaceae bacterium]|jgi:sugar lactone lactonase YvrE|nr:SMP-30/gluconolactonase/LRE family protein [Pyrinomonadaceae bacterium]